MKHTISPRSFEQISISRDCPFIVFIQTIGHTSKRIQVLTIVTIFFYNFPEKTENGRLERVIKGNVRRELSGLGVDLILSLIFMTNVICSSLSVLLRKCFRSLKKSDQ